MDRSNERETLKVIRLKAIEATPDNFKEYGQVVEPRSDEEEFGPDDAQLNLSRGVPRMYIMRLENQKPRFKKITHHASVTQCLGSIGGHVWYLGVAKPSVVAPSEVHDDSNKKEVHESCCGHLYLPPSVEEVRVFKIQGPKFLKLKMGTWHAGPFFRPDFMDFYNLELSDTNDVDITTSDFSKLDGVRFEIDDE